MAGQGALAPGAMSRRSMRSATSRLKSASSSSRSSTLLGRVGTGSEWVRPSFGKCLDGRGMHMDMEVIGLTLRPGTACPTHGLPEVSIQAQHTV